MVPFCLQTNLVFLVVGSGGVRMYKSCPLNYTDITYLDL